MALELYEINVTLSKKQKQEIRNAFLNYGKIRLKLLKEDLRGKDTLIVPTSFLKERDNDDERSLESIIGKKTFDKMMDEMLKEELERMEFLECITDDYSKSSADRNLLDQISLYKKFKKIKSLRDQDLSDRILEGEIEEMVLDYYGIFFNPGRYDGNEELEFNLDYSLLNDLEEDFMKDFAKNFVKDNIKKLFQ